MAQSTAEAALALAEELADQRAVAMSCNALGDAYAALRRTDDARARYDQALQSAREVGARHPETEALLGIASLYHWLALPDDAIRYVDQGLGIARGCGFRLLEDEIITLRADVALDRANYGAAVANARLAAALGRRCGSAPAENSALAVLSRALQRSACDGVPA